MHRDTLNLGCNNKTQLTVTKKEMLRSIGVIAWSSFLIAGIATVVFFAMFNPEQLAQVATWPMRMPAELGYTLGFFGFWAATLCSSALSLFLIKSPRKEHTHGCCKR